MKEFATDRVVTIIERPDLKHRGHPNNSLDARHRMRGIGYECHCVVSESRFRDITDFVDELSRVLQVPDRDRYLYHAHARYGNIVVRTLTELEDGGEYFLGPANGDFRYPVPVPAPASELSTPDRSDPEPTDAGEDGKRSAGSRVSGASGMSGGQKQHWGRSLSKDATPLMTPGMRQRKVIIMTNYGGSNGSISFLVDETRYKSMGELCHAVGNGLGFTRQGYSSVERICTRSGRTVSFLFKSSISHLLIIISNR